MSQIEFKTSVLCGLGELHKPHYHGLAAVGMAVCKTSEVIKDEGNMKGTCFKMGSSAEKEVELNLCTGRPHCTARNLYIKATLGIFFSTEGRIIVWLPARLPVTHSLPNCLEDTAVKE